MVFLRLSSIFQKLIENYDKVEGEVCCITLSPASPSAFEIILRYAYTDKLELSSLMDALEIKDFCIKYSIPGLMTLCEDYISKFELSKDSVWEIMDNPNAGKKLNVKIKKFLGRNTLDCIQSPKFLSCNQSSLLRVLSLEKLTVDSELQLVQAAISWAKVQNRGVELDPQTSKKLLGPCLQQLRMLTLTPSEFSMHVANSGLFSCDDTLKILINLTAPGAMEMPEGVCTVSTQRKAFGVAAPAGLEKNAAAEMKLTEQPLSEDKIKKESNIICFRGTHPGLEDQIKEIKSPIKFDVVEFKVNKDMFLSGIRIAAQINKNDESESYRETVHVAVRQVDDKKMVAFHTHIAPVSYGPGFFDIKFSKPGALLAGKLYMLDLNFKSRGVYLCKPRGHIVSFKEYEFYFSAEIDRFPFSGILQSLLLEL